jgi:hypothetical protein
VRLAEAEIDSQVVAAFDRLRIKDEPMRDWFKSVLEAKTKEHREQSVRNESEIQRQLTTLQGQQDRLLNLRLQDEIDEAAFAAKNLEIRDRIANLKSQLAAHRGHSTSETPSAVKLF